MATRISGIAAKLFPLATGPFNGRSDTEVNGLSKETVPENCDILQRGFHPYDIDKEDRREFFSVVVDDTFVELRVCTAGDWVDYDEFAVIHKQTKIESLEHLEQLIKSSYVTRITSP